MPTYALLGATGSTGSAIIRSLLSYPPKDLTLNVLVRSKAKLLKAFPDLEATAAFRAYIVEGTSSDSTAMRECLDNVDVIFCCIGSNEPRVGMSLIYDTATVVIEALKYQQKDQDSAYVPPTVIQLRSASLNKTLKAKAGWFAPNMAWFFFYHAYLDLDKACKLFESESVESPKLLDLIVVDPPSIHDPDGTVPTGHKLILDDYQHPSLSYADLGVAFCEVAERREEFVGQAVGVTATGKVTETWGVLMGYMASGMKARMWC